MIQSLLNSTSVPLLQQVLRFSEQRQRLLAGNVANIDTPGYQQRDLPVEAFQRALRDAVAGRQQPASPSAAAPRQASLDDYFPSELFQPQAAPPQNITFQDGSNRSIEQSMMELRKNAAMQRFAIEVMTSQLNLLQTVIGERA